MATRSPERLSHLSLKTGETAGIADAWWHGAGSLIAIYNGEAELFGRPDYRVARVYSGNIDMEWL